MNKSKPRIVLLDIETLPDLLAARHVWCSMSNYPGQTLKASINSVACFGYKILDEKGPAKCIHAWDFPQWKRDINDDKELMKMIYEVLKDADAFVTQNGIKFDLPFLQTRLAKHRLPLLPDIMHIDTKRLAKRHLYLFSNSLKYMAEFLTDERKMENEGWDLWEDVCDRKPEAMLKMSKYCKQDIISTEAVFQVLRPKAKLPNYNLFRNDGVECCPNCGGFEIISHGFRTASSVRYRRQQCTDCGTSFRGDPTKKIPGKPKHL